MSDQIMREIKGRITISRYAKFGSVERFRHNEYAVRPFWYVWITRLYSGVRYFEGEYKTEKDGFIQGYFYNTDKTMHPMHMSSFTKKPAGGAKIFSDWKFHIAVKELIIEWEEYQAEIAGYVHCEACEDLIDQSEWFNHDSELSNSEISNISSPENLNDSKQLLRFVKSPGLKTTNVKIQEEDLEFFPINLKQCKVKSVIEEEIVAGKSLQVRREHYLDCKIRPLFDETQALPIKYAHITVEIYLQ